MNFLSIETQFNPDVFSQIQITPIDKEKRETLRWFLYQPAILLKIHTDQTEILAIKQICVHGKLLRHWEQPGSAG
jgi:hypothetical protein